jgi:CTD small phosphatase-like protein 2
VLLPKPRNPKIKKTLFLDLDETMIHCLDDRDPENEEPDVIIRIPMGPSDSPLDDDYVDAGINIRPHLYECLRQANECFQVVVFTASDQQYANAILDHIDPHHQLI